MADHVNYVGAYWLANCKIHTKISVKHCRDPSKCKLSYRVERQSELLSSFITKTFIQSFFLLKKIENL